MDIYKKERSEMLKKLGLMALLAPLGFAVSGCYVSGYGYYVCDYYYYNADGTTDTSRDVITDVANADEERVAAVAKHYAEKFNLSDEQGLKLARTVTDYQTLQNRTEQDLADFAQRLYGVNPAEIVSAVSSAQVGDASKLNSLVTEAAQNFNTTPDNMKEIIKNLHGKALEEQGVRF
jgi:hypothetical protein